MTKLLTLDCSAGEAVRWIVEALNRVDLQVATSFDLRTARAAHTDCSCPYHGTADCDCQMVVLLVYGTDVCPATLVVHGRDGRTWLSLADVPGQRPSRKLVTSIRSMLATNVFSLKQQAQTTSILP